VFLLILAVVGLLLTAVGPAAASPALPEPVPTRGLWDALTGPLAEGRNGHPADVEADRLRAFALDHAGMRAALTSAPLESSRTAKGAPLVVRIPAPLGGFQRFAVRESPVMEPGLAARYPEIATYSGRGIDDSTATVRMDLTQLGFHASVRSAGGDWYVDPYYHLDRSVYASYYGRDLENDHGRFVEEGLEGLAVAPAAGTDALRSAGDQLRTYRLALVTDQSYATYWDAASDPANVTAAKVTLVNRVTQIYEDETSIRLVLVANNDLLDLNTNALAIEPNGPCGAAACFTESQLAGCSGGLLNRNRIVIGQIIGAGNYDIGHIGLGKSGGGVAGLGVVGGDGKARGCTGVPAPTGDYFAVDYVAHEMGHQFAGNHTFNGTQHNCSGANRNPTTSVEPGSGSSIMAYAGICRQDNTQPHSDPYWSQRSFEEIITYVTEDQLPINEVQTISLRGFDTNGDSFTLIFNGMESTPITRGPTYTVDIQAALTSVGITGTVSGFGGSGTPGDTGFQVTFTGAQSLTNVSLLQLSDLSGIDPGSFVGETAKGGPVDNKGNTVVPTGNTPPVVTAPADVTIPYRTPFALTGSATDADADTLTYMWEQNDPGAASGTGLVDPNKTNGPLFRQFGTTLLKPPYDPTEYEADGENHPTTDPTRVFPDQAQILANNTNAETGDCPGGPPPPPPTAGSATNVPQPLIDCYSEFLPRSGYAGPMHFRLTARDNSPGGGGVNSDDVTVSLAPNTGPFLVTSPNAATSFAAGQTIAVTWDVAGTAGAPIGAANVRILLSTDGGETFQTELIASTPNDGSEDVGLPATATEEGRVKIEAVGNVFFDVSNADFSIVEKLTQSITFPQPADRTFGEPDFQLTATSSSGLPVSFTDPAGDQCDVSQDGTVHLTGVGTCTATAIQDGNEEYAPAEDVSRTFTIHAASNEADVSVGASASTTSTRVGSPVTVTQVVRNDGPTADPDVDLTQLLPSGAILLDVITDPGDSCERTGDTLRCALGAMASSGSSTVRFTFVPVARGPLRTTATVSGAQDDANAGNDASTLTLEVRRAACTIRGTGADDTLKGTRGTDVICGRGGEDRVKGRGGDDVLVGRGGGDLLVGGRGVDVVAGGGGRDDLRVVDGTNGNDAALGGGGTDVCLSDPDDVVLSCE
jgi:hypothetical protein